MAGRVCIPNVVILGEALPLLWQGNSTVTEEMPPPLLVVVPPGKVKEDRDYRYQRSKYAAWGMGEYGIVESQAAQVTALRLVDRLYEGPVLRGSEAIASLQLPTLTLSVEQILQTGSSGQP